MRPIYLDYAATTPIREEVLSEMLPFFQEAYGNPGSLHDMGTGSAHAIHRARERVAAALGAQSAREIIFTSSGTEANNLALLGSAAQFRAQNNKTGHIITSSIEHPSILKTCEYLEKQNFTVTYLSVDKYGIVNPMELQENIREDTFLISIMAANNEVGSIQPIQEIAQIIQAINPNIALHSDAIQYFGKVPINVRDLGLDMMSIGSHKIYGPKGAGALYLKKGRLIKPVIFGGDQERGLRPSTLNTPAIVGFGLASQLAAQEILGYGESVSKLRDYCWQRIQDEIGDVTLNGHPTKRLPNNLNLSFNQIEGQALMLELNRSQIYTSSGSACSIGKHEASHVLMSMTNSEDIAVQSLRITLGRETNKEDIDTFIEELKKAVFYWRDLALK